MSSPHKSRSSNPSSTISPRQLKQPSSPSSSAAAAAASALTQRDNNNNSDGSYQASSNNKNEVDEKQSSSNNNNNNNTCENEEDDISVHFFPILPYGFTNDLELNGWHLLSSPSTSHMSLESSFDVGTYLHLHAINSAHSNTASLNSSLNSATAAFNNTGSLTNANNNGASSKSSLPLLTFPSQHQFIGTVLPVMTLFLYNTLQSPITVDLQVVSNKLHAYNMVFSTRNTIIKYEKKQRLMHAPLSLIKNWNRVDIDIAHIFKRIISDANSSNNNNAASNSTGKQQDNTDASSSSSSEEEYYQTYRVAIEGDCGLYRVFFSDRVYPIKHLPDELKFQPTKINEHRDL